MKCAVLGAGSWGTALSQVLAVNGHKVKLWTISQYDCDEINHKKQNTMYLPGEILHDNIFCSLDLEEVVNGAEVIVISVPSVALQTSVEKLKVYYKGIPVVLASKGRNSGKFGPLSSLVFDVLGEDIPLCILSGASHAEEVIRGIPTGVVLASKRIDLAENMEKIFENDWFKCHISDDIIGVQLMGSFKNVIALACGISDGLGYGINTKAILLTEGLQEIIRIGNMLGISRESILSYAGIGDLYVTCASPLSRNRNAGRLLASGHTKQEITGGLMKMVSEGIYMIDTIESFFRANDFSSPLFEMIISIVNYNTDAQIAFKKFLSVL